MEQDIVRLENAIIYSGFSEILVPQIMGESLKGEKEFSVFDRKTFNGNTVDYELQLRMPEDPENKVPYLKGFQATLKNEPSRTQYFDCFQDTRFTAMEAYDLLAGNTVTKSFTIDFGHQSKNNNHYINRKRVALPEEEDITQKLPRKQGAALPEDGERMGKHI